MRRLLPLLLLFPTVGASPALATGPGDSIVAVVGGQPITLDDVDVAGDADLSLLKDQLYWARLASAQDLLDRRLVEVDAKAEGLSVSSYLEREVGKKVGEVTQEEIDAFWRDNPNPAPPEEREGLAPTVRAWILHQRSVPIRAELVQRLRKKYAPLPVLNLPTARMNLDLNGRPSKGNPAAEATLVAFTDYQCAGCASMVQDLASLAGSFGEHLRIVHFDFPNDAHERAVPAAVAARCAGRFGKYWEFHDRLFAGIDDLSDERFAAIADELGLDPEGFGECRADPAVLAEIEADRAVGHSVGVTGTPHLFVNGLPLRGNLSTQQLGRAIAIELDRLRVEPPAGS